MMKFMTFAAVCLVFLGWESFCSNQSQLNFKADSSLGEEDCDVEKLKPKLGKLKKRHDYLEAQMSDFSDAVSAENLANGRWFTFTRDSGPFVVMPYVCSDERGDLSSMFDYSILPLSRVKMNSSKSVNAEFGHGVVRYVESLGYHPYCNLSVVGDEDLYFLSQEAPDVIEIIGENALWLQQKKNSTDDDAITNAVRGDGAISPSFGNIKRVELGLRFFYAQLDRMKRVFLGVGARNFGDHELKLFRHIREYFDKGYIAVMSPDFYHGSQLDPKVAEVGAEFEKYCACGNSSVFDWVLYAELGGRILGTEYSAVKMKRRVLHAYLNGITVEDIIAKLRKEKKMD